MQNNFGIGSLFFVRSLLIVLIVLMLSNLAYLDFVVFTNTKPSLQEPVILSNKPSQESIIQETSQMCPATCLAQIYEATASVKKTSVTPTPGKSTAVSSTPQTKEFFVSFGSGSNATSDWEDVAGLKAYIDSTKYSSIKTVVFEASVRIPTGNEAAYVRLFNETDKHPVWFSDVSLEGGEAKLLVSSFISLDQGNKLYKIQMKTSLKFTAILDQARIHITTN